MLYENIRVFKESGGTFTDLSLDNQEDAKVLTPALTNSEYIYIAQYFPVNNIYFHIGDTANATASDVQVEYYDGTSWRSVVDILDYTKVSGASLGRSGHIQFSPDIDYYWERILDTSDNNSPAILQSLNIYHSFWLRITFTNGIDAGTEINELTYCFTTDQELSKINVEINDYLGSFASGKTNWIPEIITASKMLLTDLKRRGLALHQGEILRFDDVYFPCTYKVLDLIYMNLGPSYIKYRIELRELYENSLAIERFTLDRDQDAFVDRQEIKRTIQSMKR